MGTDIEDTVGDPGRSKRARPSVNPKYLPVFIRVIRVIRG
jgi:hypothetical protein